MYNCASTNFNKIMEMINEGNLYAQMDNSKYIEKRHIEKAIQSKKYRIDKIEEQIEKLEDQSYNKSSNKKE